MTDFLTAEQARALTWRANPDGYVANILTSVKDAAEKGKDSIQVRSFGFGDGALYSGKPTDLQASIMAILNELGYKTEIRVEERQFVDIWLQVSWGDSK